MTDENEQSDNDDLMNELPVEGDEALSPRRMASAEFVVSAEAGSGARLREAMDPANQSLQDALRLSFRLLQVGILALLAVFLFSGFQTVEEGDLGVKTRFGAIVGTPGTEQIGPGLHPFWPYPVGEVVIVPQTRDVELLYSFWPMAQNARLGDLRRAGIDDNRSENSQLRPGIDGYLLTSDGDLAHCEVSASYAIADAASFLRELSPDDADRLVENALQRGVVLAGVQLTLNDFVALAEEPATLVRKHAQDTLDSLESGIQVLDVRLDDRTAPLAIRSQFRGVQEAKEDAKEAIDRARQAVAKEFTMVAGERAYSDLLILINEYSMALTQGDSDAADAVMARIGERFESEDIGGDAARIINQAKAYQSALETRLLSELRRLETLAPTFRKDPRQFARRLWLEAYRDVFDNEQLEVFSMPLDLARIDLAIQSSEDVMQSRRDSELQRKKNAMLAEEGALIGGFQWGRSQIILEGPGRRLERDTSGGFGREEDN